MAQDKTSAAIQADYLTNVLRNAGVLDDGSVRDVMIDSDRSTMLSRIIRLRLRYDGEPPDAPSSIICKTGPDQAPAAGWNGGEREVAFYTQIAPHLSVDSVPRCFDARWNEDTGTWHLLLEDLTDTHLIATQWPLPPSQPQCETIITARARLHAAWWDDPRLGVSIGRWMDADDIGRHQQRTRDHYAVFADSLGDNLTADRRELFERLLDSMPYLASRYRTRRNISIVQGDAHVWNCFLPREPSGGVRFFDWDAWSIHVPVNDLSYMMAMHWYPDRRRQLEQPLLDLYHRILLEHGVSFYDRRMLQDDYRWSVLWRLALPLLQAAIGIPPLVWWNNLERILMAVDDLGCREFLG